MRPTGSPYRREEDENVVYEYETLPSEDYLAATPLLPADHNHRNMIPKDGFSVSYFIFYLLGLGSLLPWNFFITANEYWMYKFGSENGTTPSTTTESPAFTSTAVAITSTLIQNDDTTVSLPLDEATQSYNSLQLLFMNSLALCAMLPNVIFQFLNTLLQKHIPQNVRVVTTIILMIVLFILTEVFVKMDESSWQMTFFVITLITVVLVNSCSAILQSSVFGLAACFPQKFSGAVMAGQGMGGVFAALAMIAALGYSNSPTDSAFIFFLTAIVVLTLTLILYGCLVRLDFYKFYARTLRGEDNDNDFKELPLSDTGEADPCLDEAPINGVWVKPQNDVNNDKEPFGNEAINGSDYEVHIRSDGKNASSSPLIHIVKKIWLHMFAIAYSFFITLACFPAVTASIKSTATGTMWGDVYFSPVCCFLLFNLSDWIGRTSASYIHIPSANNKTMLLVCVLLRTVFPFLFALCNVVPRSNLPVVFVHDAYFIIFMSLFGLSNGHLTTLCMQYGPKQVELEHAPTAGSMLAFMISVGLLAGAGTSFLVKMCI